MSIAKILKKSLRESIRPKRFLPFFLLYLFFSLGFLFLLMTILQKFPSLVVEGFQANALSLLTVNITAIIVIITLVALLNLWFTGALIYSSIANKGFDAALKYSQKVFWQLLFFHIAFLLLTVIVGIIPILGSLFQIAIDVAFFFSIPAIVIKKDAFQVSMTRSYAIAKNNLSRTFFFWLSVKIIGVLIFIISLFLIMIPLTPLLTELSNTFILQRTLSTEQVLQLASSILNNYTSLLAACILASFFIAVIHVFNYLSRTYYFQELKKK